MNDIEAKRRYYELSEQGKREEGIEFLEEYIKNAGDDVSAELLSHTGNVILIYSDELEKGIEYFHRAIEKEPENTDIYWTYFTDLDEITDEYPETIDDAILCLTKVIEHTINLKLEEASEISADNLTKKRYRYHSDINNNFDKEASIARRYCDLAVIYMKIPNFDEAEKCIDKTLAVLPEHEYAIEIKNILMEAKGIEQQRQNPDDGIVKTEVYVFSRENDLEFITNVFCDCFDNKMKREDNHLYLENGIYTLDIFVFMAQMGDEYKELVRNQKNMVCGHFAQVEDCDEDIKINFIHHMQQSNTFMPVKLQIETDDNELQMIVLKTTISTILDALKKVDGILLVNGATVALNSEEEIILTDDGMSQLEHYFPFEYIDSPAYLSECTPAQIARRNENMKELFDKRIFVIELPVNDDDDKVSIRKKEEIVKRTLGTMAISLYSEALLNPAEQMEIIEARAFVKKVMESYGVTELTNVMTPDEWEYFIDDNSDRQTRIEYSWHYEHLYALEWALGLDEWTEPVDLCDVPKSVRVLREIGNIDDIINETNVRSKKEILDKADLIYRMDWACVDARIYGMDSPGGMNPGVVQARHKTLNWLIRLDDADWDDVGTPT